MLQAYCSENGNLRDNVVLKFKLLKHDKFSYILIYHKSWIGNQEKIANLALSKTTFSSSTLPF
ncbi:hypothetical protein HYC85_027920 [Camellia sinensis]|uniref:Uncharacterized protein n=1 Tax=Camellia sinensis TaxID=4442 RepID=A0A7J7FTY9_CAMSI|nr:hypothetical protein HYC85_027920 [Camellia sinensis]